MVVLLLGMSLAQADVVGPGPPECPDGSIGGSSHSGAFCVPGTCASGCEEGQQCAPAGLCVREVERDCGGRTPEPCTYTQLEVSGSCATDGDCSTGTCQVADRCVPMPPVVSAPAWCGCTTAGGAGTAAFLFGLLPLLARRERDEDGAA